MSESLPLVVEYRHGLFFPAGRTDLVAERHRREALSRAFLDRHRRLLRVFCAVPYTRMVALSGSIAHMNLEGTGDLDLFIVTRGAHVWSVTVAVLLLAKLFGRRDVTCANFVVADSHLELEQQDLFTANQTIHLKPLVGGGLLREFVAANPFVGEIYPNFRPSDEPAFGFRQPAAVVKAKAAVEWALHLPSAGVEALCRSAYGWHLRRRAPSWRSPGQVRLERDCLKLHTRSHRHSILERFDSAVLNALAVTGRRDCENTDSSVSAPLRAGRRR
jgi:hypothetical protein